MYEVLGEARVVKVLRMWTHHERHLDPARQPNLVKWCAASADERWLQPIDDLVDDAIACYREHFGMVLEDVLAKAGARPRPLLVEGTTLLPGEVAGVVSSGERALWLLSAPDFQRRHYRERAWAWSVVASSSDPERAFENWMERDVRFAAWVAAKVDALGLRRHTVDGGRTAEEVADEVARRFGWAEA